MAQSLRILHLEDSAADAELIRDALERAGYDCSIRVEATGPGFERALVEPEPWELILCDYSMPGYDGMRAIEAARRSDSGVPIILLTGTLGEERAVDCLRAGATDLVLKGSLGRLGPVVSRALREVEERRRRREIEDRYRITLQSVGDAVIATDRVGRVDMMNPVAETLTGWSESDARGRPLAEVFRIVNEATRESVPSPVDEVIRLGTVVGLANHTVLLARDGREVPIADSGAPIRDRTGRIVGVVLVFRDQTRERAARRALEEAKERAQRYLDMVAVMVVALDGSGRVVQVNRKGCQILGRPEDELLGADWFDTCVPPSKSGEVREVFGRLVSGELQGLEYHENPVLRADGEERLISWHNAVVRDAAGGFQCCLSSGLDVTDERRMQAEAARNQARLRSLLAILQYEAATTQEFLDHALAEALVLTESRLGYIYFYDEERRLFELNTWSKEVMAQCSVVEPKTTYDLDKTGVWGDAVRTRRPVILNDFAAPHPGKRGQPAGHAPLSRFLTVPVICGGRIVAVVGVANKDAPYGDTDVLQLTLLMDSVWKVVEQRRAKERHEELQEQFLQAQKMEAVGRLAGGVAHDFNNMLQAIIGNADLALDEAGDNVALREAVAEIHQAAGRAADLTRGLLAFARKQTVSPRSLDLGETVAGTLKMLRRLIGEDIDLAWMPGHDLWPVSVDPTQVDQILTNLVVNARDAIVGVGKVTIETANVTVDEAYCRTNPGFVPGDYVVLSVTDDGCGMERETQTHLFEPFFTTKGVGKGTGLGLATVYGIVKQNGGLVNVYSEPGQGSTFRIYLPRTDAVPAADVEGEEIVAGGTETILLVEDEPAILRLGRQVLARRGYTVLVAATPSEALHLARTHQGPIHLMVTDVVMPEMNGQDLVEQVRAVVPAIRSLFMSGYTASAIAHQGVLDPGVEFLPKPFSASALASRVRQVLDRD